MFRFDGTIAKMTSPNAAVVFHHISFCVTSNKRNGTNLIDGKYWTFDSRKSYTERFFYMTEDMVRTAIKKLIDAGLIEKGNFATDKMDNRNWYTLTELGWEFNYWRKDANGNLIEDVIATDNPKVLLGGFTHKSGKRPQPTGEISPVTTDIYHTDNITTDIYREKKNNARAREEIIADIIENNTAWVENQIKAGIEPNDIPALLNFAYDYHINTKGEEPGRQQLMSDAFYQLRNFKEHKRREAIRSRDIEERKRELWKKLLPFIGKEFPRPMVVEFYKFCINLNDGIMYFEQWPEYDLEASLRQHKVKYEQRNKHSAL